MTTCTRRLEWDSAHRVLRHESKCASLHGHRYAAEITCSAEHLDEVGRVIDFGAIKERVGAWIDENWDHTTLVNADDRELWEWCLVQERTHGHRSAYEFHGEPTAENIARELRRVASDLLEGTGVTVVMVRVYETPNCWADT